MVTKKEFSSFSLILSLVITCAFAALALATVNELTKDPIAKAREAAKMEAVLKVLPKEAKDPKEVLFNTGGTTVTAYVSRDAAGALLGVAVPVADKGFGGTINMMVGLSPDGKFLAAELLTHQETPGLGDGVGNGKKFLDQLVSNGESDISWTVTKDGGDVDAVTAATISSRAALRAITKAFPVYTTVTSK